MKRSTALKITRRYRPDQESQIRALMHVLNARADAQQNRNGTQSDLPEHPRPKKAR